MGKIFKTLLLSTVILTVCGSNEETVEEPVVDNVLEEVDHSSYLPISKDFARLQDSYFYKETTGYRMRIPETHI